MSQTQTTRFQFALVLMTTLITIVNSSNALALDKNTPQAPASNGNPSKIDSNGLDLTLPKGSPGDYKIVISESTNSARFSCEKLGALFDEATNMTNQIICDKGSPIKADIYIDLKRNKDDSFTLTSEFPFLAEKAEPTGSRFTFLAQSDDDVIRKVKGIFQKDHDFIRLKNYYKAVILKPLLVDLNEKKKKVSQCEARNKIEGTKIDCSKLTGTDAQFLKYDLNETTGVITDTDTNTPVTPQDVYYELVEGKTDYEHKFRQGLEMFLNFSVGLYWYKSAEAEMSKDWDYTDKPRIDRYKGFQQWRHDNNGRAINWPHTLAGMTYYQVTRTNNFSAYESLLWTIAASSAWEFIVEYREVVSINDQVFTGIAGAFFGEVLYQFSVALRSSNNSILSKTLSYLFNGAGAINMYFDRYKTIIDRRSDLPDHLKEFKIGVYVQQYLQDSAKNYAPGIIMKGKIINISEYVSDGKASGWAKGTILSELDMHGAFANMDMTDVEIAVKLAFEGYYRKNIKETKNGLTGFSYVIAPSHGIEYSNREATDPQQDWFANCHVVGTTLDMSIYKNGLKYNFVFDVFADYAMIRSYALNKYKQEQGDLKGTRSIIQSAGYYYAFGATSQLKMSLEMKNWQAGVSLRQHYWDSIDSRDRFQEYKVKNNDYKDLARIFTLWAGYRFNKTHELTLEIEKYERKGKIVDKEFNTITASQGNTNTEYRLYYTYHLLNNNGL